MAGGVRLKPPGHGWVAMAAVLAAGSLMCTLPPSGGLDWQPGLAWREPWRWWTAACVHWSPLHLGANLLGTLLVALLGVAARLPPPMCWAWFAAWPLTQLGWLLRPELAHFGGLSGVLHAGVAVVVVDLLWWSERGARPRPRRGASLASRSAIGIALGLGLLAKLGLEAPWGPVLRHPQGWDIAIAPWSHACGVVAGLGCALLARILVGPRARLAPSPSPTGDKP